MFSHTEGKKVLKTTQYLVYNFLSFAYYLRDTSVSGLLYSPLFVHNSLCYTLLSLSLVFMDEGWVDGWEVHV